MERTATLSSPCIIGLPPNKLLHSPVSSPPNLSFFHNQTFHFDHRTTLRLRLSICHGQLDGSGGEDPYEIHNEAVFDDDDDDDVLVDEITSDDEDDTESSVDLLIRFLQTIFKKLSKRAKKASRSILPAGISSQLVSFAVDGILLLASLSIIKALLEVVCTLGGTVFMVILLLRVVWAAISYFQSNGNISNQSGSSFGTIYPNNTEV